MAIDFGEVTGLNASKDKKKEAPKIANGLDKDAFMKLFLEQLKNQDPTAPMETDKIISQTAQLTQVEMQEENKQTMKEVAKAMQSTESTNKMLQESQKDVMQSLRILNEGMSSNAKAQMNASKINALNAMSMIGKIAETTNDTLDFKGSGNAPFSLYFDNKIDATKGTPMIEVLNENKAVVKKIALNDKDGKQGYVDFVLDGKDDNGNNLPAGKYSIIAHYNLDENNQYAQTKLGRGEIQSVIYQKGVPLLRMQNDVMPMDKALEFYAKGDTSHLTTNIDSIKDKVDKIIQEKESEENKVENEEKAKDSNNALNDKFHEMLAHNDKDKDNKPDMKQYEKMLDDAIKAQNKAKKDQVQNKDFTNVNDINSFKNVAAKTRVQNQEFKNEINDTNMPDTANIKKEPSQVQDQAKNQNIESKNGANATNAQNLKNENALNKNTPFAQNEINTAKNAQNPVFDNNIDSIRQNALKPNAHNDGANAQSTNPFINAKNENGADNVQNPTSHRVNPLMPQNTSNANTSESFSNALNGAGANRMINSANNNILQNALNNVPAHS